MTKEEAKARLTKLVAKRDATLHFVRGKEELLRKVAADTEAARVMAEDLAKEISLMKGGPEWIKLKAEIASLYSRGIKPNPLLPEPSPEVEKLEEMKEIVTSTKSSGWFRRLLGR